MSTVYQGNKVIYGKYWLQASIIATQVNRSRICS
jgi:hypothetical protein